MLLVRLFCNCWYFLLLVRFCGVGLVFGWSVISWCYVMLIRVWFCWWFILFLVLWWFRVCGMKYFGWCCLVWLLFVVWFLFWFWCWLWCWCDVWVLVRKMRLLLFFVVWRRVWLLVCLWLRCCLLLVWWDWWCCCWCCFIRFSWWFVWCLCNVMLGVVMM